MICRFLSAFPESRDFVVVVKDIFKVEVCPEFFLKMDLLYEPWIYSFLSVNRGNVMVSN